MSDCKSFLALNPDENIKVVKENKLCYSCLRTEYRSPQCRSRNQCPEGCERYHHEMLHQAYVEDVSFHAKGQVQKSSDEDCGACLLQLMQIKSGTLHSIPLIVFWDGGSTISLITFQRAAMLNLQGEEVKIPVTKVDGKQEEIILFVYDLPLINSVGEIVHFRVYGINRISTELKAIIIENVLHLFHGITGKKVRRPTGEIDVLVGFEYAGHHPVREQPVGHLLLLGNRFGKCLGGSHPLLKGGTKKLVWHVSVNHIRHVSVEDFCNIGFECSPWCCVCKCDDCPLGGKS